MVPIIAHLLSSSRYAKQPSKKVFPSIRPQTPNRFLFGSVWVHGAARQVRALSEELENPMNVHRWRKLEGSDPVMYELIQKARPPVRCRAGFQTWENAKPTRFFQKKREEGTNKKKGGYKNKSWGIFSLVPLISTIFSNGSLVSCSRIFHGNDWGVIC